MAWHSLEVHEAYIDHTLLGLFCFVSIFFYICIAWCDMLYFSLPCLLISSRLFASPYFFFFVILPYFLAFRLDA